jgi:hypothetical protein
MRGRKRTVTVNDKMQKGYRYQLTVPIGRSFDPEFKPDLTPQQMLRLGVFCGKYMTDARKEFPASWFKHAKLSPRGPARSISSASTLASRCPMEAKRMNSPRRPARLVPVVLPLLHGPAHAGRRPPSDQALEGDPPPRSASREKLRAGRTHLPQAPAPGAAALGLQAASCTYRIALGPRAGQKVLSLQSVPSADKSSMPDLCQTPRLQPSCGGALRRRSAQGTRAPMPLYHPPGDRQRTAQA